MEYLQYQLHVSISILAMVRFVFNLLSNITICVVYFGGGGQDLVPPPRVFFFQAPNFLVESFCLLKELFPFPSILDAGYPVFIFIWQMSCLMLSSHLYLGLPCDLLVRGFQLNIFLTVPVSGILCT
jgi:hypothetical protein